MKNRFIEFPMRILPQAIAVFVAVLIGSPPHACVAAVPGIFIPIRHRSLAHSQAIWNGEYKTLKSSFDTRSPQQLSPLYFTADLKFWNDAKYDRPADQKIEQSAATDVSDEAAVSPLWIVTGNINSFGVFCSACVNLGSSLDSCGSVEAELTQPGTTSLASRAWIQLLKASLADPAPPQSDEDIHINSAELSLAGVIVLLGRGLTPPEWPIGSHDCDDPPEMAREDRLMLVGSPSAVAALDQSAVANSTEAVKRFAEIERQQRGYPAIDWGAVFAWEKREYFAGPFTQKPNGSAVMSCLVRLIAWSEDGNRLIIAGGDDTLHLCYRSSGNEVCSLRCSAGNELRVSRPTTPFLTFDDLQGLDFPECSERWSGGPKPELIPWREIVNSWVSGRPAWRPILQSTNRAYRESMESDHAGELWVSEPNDEIKTDFDLPAKNAWVLGRYANISDFEPDSNSF